MHDLKFIRKNPEKFDQEIEKRGFALHSKKIIELDKKNRESIGNLQDLKEVSNKLAKEIGELKKNGKDAVEQIEKSKKIKAQISALKDGGEVSGEFQEELDTILLSLPNILHTEIPEGTSEDDNIEIERFGKPRDFTFSPKEHDEIGEQLGLLDFAQTAKISGSRFVTLKGDLALLERALSNFMLDIVTKDFGFIETSPPILVNTNAMIGTGQLPKFGEDSFKTTDKKWLISTAEISLTNLVREKILAAEELPIRLAAYTPCFRSEAGAAGKDTKGIIRQHQFYKVELVTICTEDKAKQEQERILEAATHILKKLEIPYRKMLLCAGDTGFSSAKTIDVEVWLPGQNKYREISSCSDFGSFQARRMSARYRDQNNKLNFLNTLNGSALAIGRTIVAILENYQQEDGSVAIPKSLRSYMGGREKIQIDK